MSSTQQHCRQAEKASGDGNASGWSSVSAGCQGTYDGPYVNHTCCIQHVNAGSVSTEDYGSAFGAPRSTVNVRNTKDAVDR